jgi:hypothetical protein
MTLREFRPNKRRSAQLENVAEEKGNVATMVATSNVVHHEQ